MTTQYVIDKDGWLVGVYEGPVQLPNSVMIEPPHVEGMVPRWLDGAWVDQVRLPMLTPMTLYMAFKPLERIAIKNSSDPLVQEFWAMYQLSVQLGKPTDPNLLSVREAIAYLAAPKDPGPGAGILEGLERVDEILAGIPQ